MKRTNLRTFWIKVDRKIIPFVTLFWEKYWGMLGFLRRKSGFWKKIFFFSKVNVRGYRKSVWKVSLGKWSILQEILFLNIRELNFGKPRYKLIITSNSKVQLITIYQITSDALVTKLHISYISLCFFFSLFLYVCTRKDLWHIYFEHTFLCMFNLSMTKKNRSTSTVSTRKPQPLGIFCLREDLNPIFGARPTLCTQYLPMTRNSNILVTPKESSENEFKSTRLHAKGTSQIFNRMMCKIVGFPSITLQRGRISNLKKQRSLREKRITWKGKYWNPFISQTKLTPWWI